MNHEPLKAVLEASSKILSEMARVELQYGEPRLKERPFGCHEISVIVGFSGDLSGVVNFSLTPEAAMSLASRFMEGMGAKPPAGLDEEAMSALAELVNTIMGHYMIAMETRGSNVTITPVTVIMGSGVTFGVDGITCVSAVTITLPVGSGEITVALK